MTADPLNRPVRVLAPVPGYNSQLTNVRPADVIAALDPEQRQAVFAATAPGNVSDRVVEAIHEGAEAPPLPLGEVNRIARAVLTALGIEEDDRA